MTKRRTQVLKIHSLDHRWHDKDEVLLHAAFQVLADFIEKEQPDRYIDWSANALHKHAWREIKHLYKWWREKRPARRSPFDDKQLIIPSLRFKKIPDSELHQMVEPDRKRYAAYYRALRQEARLEQKWYEEDQRNLHRLIEVRGFLWT
ncbi:hypothetical protein [Candidatus Methylomirabilis sp.]|uniref:hypothetical protein n=1 Tax=Candidatus Methylomirabilis sp. TaxID=2032687 RepID=UPI002A67E19E|nr:hypothetical protein [Candidatus Methylomirabilis sp.]